MLRRIAADAGYQIEKQREPDFFDGPSQAATDVKARAVATYLGMEEVISEAGMAIQAGPRDVSVAAATARIAGAPWYHFAASIVGPIQSGAEIARALDVTTSHAPTTATTT